MVALEPPPRALPIKRTPRCRLSCPRLYALPDPTAPRCGVLICWSPAGRAVRPRRGRC